MPAAPIPTPSRTPSRTPRPSRGKPRVWRFYALLVLPFIGTLWVPFFNSAEPRLGGVPFFYWYQFLWIAISTVLTGVVYFATRDADQ